MRNGGAAHKNMEAPRNFDSASRRRHPERSRGIFLALRSVSHRHWQGTDALLLCIPTFTHESFISLQERFLDFARNDDTREMLDSSIPTNSTKRKHFLIPNP